MQTTDVVVPVHLAFLSAVRLKALLMQRFELVLVVDKLMSFGPELPVGKQWGWDGCMIPRKCSLGKDSER